MDPSSFLHLIEIQDEIRADFGWGLEADLNSARELRGACEDKSETHPTWTDEGRQATLLRLQERLISAPLTILGAAAEVEDVQAAIQDGHNIIAADGAVGVLTETDLPEIAWDTVQCVVSDADGDPPHLAIAAERGIPFILHAHGDNIDEWTNFIDILHLYGTPLILTHQTPEHILGMHNPGGFTDGDRAVCIALSMNVPPNQLTLRGFRTDIIGRWTGATIPERKMRKLEWMRRILEIAGVRM
ncbi:MAG: hypothetical protein OSB33_01270 [Candidatus Poseidoniales archaeon]|nr:hypothetical protein [Candidatus Poseidoniales archaeon]